MSIKPLPGFGLLIAGMQSALGNKPSRRQRHTKSQMKFFSKSKPKRRGKFLSWK